MEQSYGAETYFDADGNFVFAQAPTGAEPVVWTVDATGIMVDADEALDRTGIYNGVLVRGQATGEAAPVSAVAYYTTPDLADPLGRPVRKGAAGRRRRGDHGGAGADDGQRAAQTEAQADP